MTLRTGVRGETDAALREEVAWGCRILAYFSHNDLTLGHVSARRRGGDAMLMKGKGIALDEVTPANVVPIDFRGRRLEGSHPIHFERALTLPVCLARLHLL